MSGSEISEASQRGLFMEALASYIKEIKYLKLYITVIVLAIILSYSVYIFFNVETVSRLGEENHFFEWLTFIFFIAASVLFVTEGIKSRNTLLIIVGVVMFIGAGEEISWGQSVFGWKTPAALAKINVQDETNLHNIIYVNSRDFQGNWKHGWQRLLEINFLFKLSFIFCGIILPLLIYHFRFASKSAIKFRIPVPPVSIGILFLVSWFGQHIIRTYLIPLNSTVRYNTTAQEISEFLDAFILFMIALYFYNNRKIMIFGKDIKQVI